MNNKHYCLFIAKNISCVQFSSRHTSDKKLLTLNFSQTTVPFSTVMVNNTCTIMAENLNLCLIFIHIIHTLEKFVGKKAHS